MSDLVAKLVAKLTGVYTQTINVVDTNLAVKLVAKLVACLNVLFDHWCQGIGQLIHGPHYMLRSNRCGISPPPGGSMVMQGEGAMKHAHVLVVYFDLNDIAITVEGNI